MILLLAACRLVLLVARKSEENCNLDEVAPLVALRLATFDIDEVIFPIVTDEIVTAAAVVAALPRLMVELTLSASLRFKELIEIEAPESPLVEMYTLFEFVAVVNRLKELKVSLVKLLSDFCNSLNSEA
jgi:hypothetical protein